MKRKFKKVDYIQALDLTVSMRDCLPFDHLARFVVDCVAQLNLSNDLCPLWAARRRAVRS